MRKYLIPSAVLVIVLGLVLVKFSDFNMKPQTVKHKYTNRLIDESSPYLLQHAHNPVEVYPWGSEAFERAKKENKPIFLSIGYSTCHWCHVMEDESFSNDKIAKIMNNNFINIKVDREERPDVDKIYMDAVVAMTGSGGLDSGNRPGTVAKKMRHLKRMFQLAVDRRQLEDNPLARIKPPKSPKKKIRVFSPDECRRLLQASKEFQISCTILTETVK